MFTMIKTPLIPLAFGSILAATAASAQSVTFAQVDTDGNGMLSRAELVAAFGEGGADQFLINADVDTDQMVSPEEVGTISDMAGLVEPLDITNSEAEEG